MKIRITIQRAMRPGFARYAIMHMVYLCTMLLFSYGPVIAQQQRVIWSIGKKDNSAAEFALAPDRYRSFLKEDFGWESRSFVVGVSGAKKDWPYVLPGPADAWGGTSGTAGLRTHVLNVLFHLDKLPGIGGLRLYIDLLNAQHQSPPYLKVTVNDRSWKFTVPPGNAADTLGGNTRFPLGFTIDLPLDAAMLHAGTNEIRLSNLEGSWLVFDDLRLEGPAGISADWPVRTALLRSVKTADYQVGDSLQPLLLDVERLSGKPKIAVELDGKQIWRTSPDNARSVFEVPMPASARKRVSKYRVLIDGKAVATGSLERGARDPVTPADYVDTYLGSAHSRWMIAPGPWMPFSMVKLSPDNQEGGWQAGYEPSLESIGTFSHIHEWTMAGLGTMPVNGPLKLKVGAQSGQTRDSTGYRSAIDKASEQTGLGYYSVQLTDYAIRAELTSTTRCSFQRYHYPSGKDGRVMVDLKIPAEYGYEVLRASLKKLDDQTIEGYSVQRSKGVWSTDADQEYTIFFRMEFDQRLKRFGTWENETVSDATQLVAENPGAVGCFVEFDTNRDSVVQVRTGISYVDAAGARSNLEQELSTPFGWSFDAVRKFNRDTWNGILNRVQITSNDRREKTRFYTNLYRSFCRNLFSDVDGRWVDATEQIRQAAPGEVALGCDAFWNTFWNLNQAWNLVVPEWSSKWSRSQLNQYKANGWLAKGPAGMEYIPVMVGEHEIPFLVSAWQMGIRDTDPSLLFEAIRKTVSSLPEHVGNGLAGNRDIAAYLEHGFVPADKGRFSNTLEYAYDNWTVAQLAKTLKKTDDEQLFAEGGSWWKNAIDSTTGFARMRNSDRSWVTPFDPYKTGANEQYVEGNAWQLTYFVPQDVPALIKAIGRDRFLDRLHKGFLASERWRYNSPGDQYWDFPVVQGNQQSMHFAFLFNWAGEPWNTQRWSRSIMERYYGYGAADAYLGDEDQGQMSAWFVMAAIGLFQTDGGASAEPVYEIASPLYEQVVIDLGGRYGRGKKFVIRAKQASASNKYVQRATLNGKSLTSFRFPARELLGGGELVLEMGPVPNKDWGIE